MDERVIQRWSKGLGGWFEIPVGGAVAALFIAFSVAATQQLVSGGPSFNNVGAVVFTVLPALMLVRDFARSVLDAIGPTQVVEGVVTSVGPKRSILGTEDDRELALRVEHAVFRVFVADITNRAALAAGAPIRVEYGRGSRRVYQITLRESV